MQKLRKIEADSSWEQKLKIINFPNGRREVIPPSLIALHSGELAHILLPSYLPVWKGPSSVGNCTRYRNKNSESENQQQKEVRAKRN